MTLEDLLSGVRNSAEHRRYMRRARTVEVATGWMRHLPFGQLVYAFWSNLLTNGVRDTIRPRWGALTFAFLNDGWGPTVWHTLRSIHHDNDCKYTGIYVDGAPRSRAEALNREIVTHNTP